MVSAGSERLPVSETDRKKDKKADRQTDRCMYVLVRIFMHSELFNLEVEPARAVFVCVSFRIYDTI